MLIGGKSSDKGETLRAFDFVGFGKTVIVISALTIVSGALYYRAHGLNLDIDFTSGTALDIDLDRSVDQDNATRIMSEAGTVPATVAIGGNKNEHIAARFDEILQPAELKRIIAAFQSKYGKSGIRGKHRRSSVARDFATRAIYAVAAAFVSIFLYIGLRFSWSIALATVVPIFQDILIVSAIFSLFKHEIDVTYIAALLTIIGYSLNDKIVIFGRIRENLKRASDTSSDSLRDLVNQSIRQTLGRSIYTVLTVVVASACLYLFACEPLQMFALAILLGRCRELIRRFSCQVFWALDPCTSHGLRSIQPRYQTLSGDAGLPCTNGHDRCGRYRRMGCDTNLMPCKSHNSLLPIS